MESDSDTESETALISRRGKIESVHVSNFVTFKSVSFHPSDELNLLIGPNGSGKSSIVAAIVIGMGGTTKVLSSKLKLGNYVKNGENEASITINLYKSDKGDSTIKFNRQFGKNNKSIYHINDRQVSEIDYLTKIRSMHIQVDNLCQFLPQDRVQDFAKQNPQQLFMSTQKAVCTDELIAQFEELLNFQDARENGSSIAQRNLNMLTQHEKRLEALESAVATIRERERLLKSSEVIKMKIAWMEFEKAYMRCQEIDKDYKLAKKNFLKRKEEHEKVLDETKQFQIDLDKLNKNFNAKTAECQKEGDELERIADGIKKLREILRHQKQEFDHLKLTADERVEGFVMNKRLQSKMQESYTQKLNQFNVEENTQQILRIDNEILGVREKVKKLSTTRTTLNQEIDLKFQSELGQIDRQLDNAKNERGRRMAYIAQHHANTYEAMQWLSTHRDQFKYKVFDPIFVEMNIKCVDHIKVIENCIGNKDLIAFVFEDSDDMNKFLKIVRVDLKLRLCNAICSNAKECTSRASEPIEKFRKFGALSYLIDSIEAPPQILQHLCNQSGIHRIMIGTAELERNVDHLPNWVQLLFTPEYRVQVNTSKYTGEKIIASDNIRPRNIFGQQISQEQMNELKLKREQIIRQRDTLRNRRQELETAIEFCEADIRKKNDEKDKYSELDRELRTLKTKLDIQMRKTVESRALLINIETETVKYDEKRRPQIEKLISLQSKLTSMYGEYCKLCISVKEAKKRSDVFRNSGLEMERMITDAQEAFDRSKKYAEKIEEILTQKKNECKQIQMNAMKLTDGKTPRDGKQFPYKAEFDALSNDIEVLSDELASIETELVFQDAPQQESIEEYKHHEKQVELLRQEIKKSKKSQGSLEARIRGAHDQWYPEIQRIVRRINRHFEMFMKQIDCAGEIEIIRKNENDYKSYGIEIRVKYRSNEQLKPLDRFVQSGGERAVAIAVYSLSLQHLSQVPFRCVDEINQGMDATNERRVFGMLVNTVAQPNKSQFFYVTPKLLPNLPINEYVSCSVVHNGQLIDDETKEYFDK